MKIAFLFAGQGSQHPGMGQDFYETYPQIRPIFDEPQLDFDLKTLCFSDPEGQLNQTQYTQPCMVAFAVAVATLLKEEGIQPEMAAGLSLGEYSALFAAGVLDAKTVVELTAFRGKAMATAVQGIPCGMTAVLGLDRETLQTCCDQAKDLGLVEIANYNCTGQLAIAGEAAAVEKAGQLASEAGAKRCVPLKVSGPFHTSMMHPAGDALEEKFKSVTFGPMQFPVIFNATAKPLADGKTVPEMLVTQVQSSVYFEDTLKYMDAQGIDTFVEIGPGKALSGFVKKTLKDKTILAIENVAGFQAAVEKLKG